MKINVKPVGFPSECTVRVLVFFSFLEPTKNKGEKMYSVSLNVSAVLKKTLSFSLAYIMYTNYGRQTSTVINK